jgi:Alginate lyase
MRCRKLIFSALAAISLSVTATATATATAAESAEAAQAAPAPDSFTPAMGQSLCRGIEGYAEDFGGRRTFLWRPEWLKQIKAARDASKITTDALLAEAEKSIKRGPYSVVDKQKVPASGDKHDYYSLGPYWWPTPGKPNGEPYSRKDGNINPERDGSAFDASSLIALTRDVATLSLAYYYSGDRRYSAHAALLVRTWFLNPATRMNPNLAYAQAVPGISAGRAEGIIDAHRFMPIIESVGLLASSGAISPNEQKALELWFGDLVTWMASSPTGKQERAKKNNHGIYYDLLMSHFALFARRSDVTKAVVNAFAADRIATQFAVDGSLPEELTRTRSWHYTHWTLLATSQLAGLGECVGLDLWKFRTADGRGLRRSLDWLARYAGPGNKWPYPESAFAKGGNLSPANRIAMENFRTAAWGYRDTQLEAVAEHYADIELQAEENNWLAPFQKN